MESSYGVRYLILLSLPYFDPVQYTVVDPMHNLFLGTGKHVMRVWVEMNIISQEALGGVPRMSNSRMSNPKMSNPKMSNPIMSNPSLKMSNNYLNIVNDF